MTFEQLVHIRSLCLRCMGIVIMVGIMIYMAVEIMNGSYLNGSLFLSVLLFLGFAGGTAYGSAITYFKIKNRTKKPAVSKTKRQGGRPPKTRISERSI